MAEEEPNIWRGISNGPLWLRALLVLGFPGGVAIFLLLVLTGVLPSTLSSQVGQIRLQVTTNEQVMAAMRQDFGRTEREQTWLLRMICRNTAQSVAIRIECDRQVDGRDR